MPSIPRAAAQDGDADADADVVPPAPPALPAPLSAGRHAATYELECIRLRKKIDAQGNTIINLVPEIVNLDKKTVRALRERDYVQQEAEAQQEGASAAAEEASGTYEPNLKQQQATASVKYKAMLKQMQEKRDASSDK
eukprot:4543950-Pleurochrysis_carterae.AAC.1